MMAVFSSKKHEPLDRRRSLGGIPVVNNEVSIEADATGQMMISVKRRRQQGFLGRFQPAVTTRKFRLDELGSFVVGQIDGHKSAGQIVEAFVDHFRTNRREAELSVVAFLKTLAQRRVISILIR